jgi:hypothetical protein
MAFFAPPSLLQKSKKQSKPFEGRMDLLILANAKKMGVSFDELALFRVRDFLEFTDIYFGEVTQQQGEQVREATQEDIDKLLG